MATGGSTYISTLADVLNQQARVGRVALQTWWAVGMCAHHTPHTTPACSARLPRQCRTISCRSIPYLHCPSQKPPNAFELGVRRISYILIAFMAAMVPLVVVISGYVTGNWPQVTCRTACRHPAAQPSTNCAAANGWPVSAAALVCLSSCAPTVLLPLP